MSGNLSQQELELYRATDEVLHYIWDPIGVSAAANARDEYRSYLPGVFKLLMADKPDKDIIDFLLEVTTERMELKPNIEKAKQVVEILNEYKGKIFETAL